MTEISIEKTISELRNLKGVTQEEVAAALSVSNKTVSKWENGDSSPDITALAQLAEYYGVSTDYLLGLKGESKCTAEIIADEFKGLDRRKSALKLFEIVKDTFPPCFAAAGIVPDENSENEAAIPPQDSPASRNLIAHRDLFQFLVCSDDVNFAVIQTPNKSNFNWFGDSEKMQKISRFLSSLSDTDTMKIMHFIHSQDCSITFTADYIAKNTSVEVSKVVGILNNCEIMCKKRTAHLKKGTAEIYESFGNGLILSIFSIAYELIFGDNSYNYCYGATSKILRGEKK